MSQLARNAFGNLTPVMLTKSGRPKSRWTLDSKLELLDEHSCREATLSRVTDFRDLFAFRGANGIVTRRGQGSSAWTAYRGILGDREVIDHLLADRIPNRPPVWFGARSFPTSRFLCLDVDADRTPQQILAKKYPRWDEMPKDLYATELNVISNRLDQQTPRPSFADRCNQVETCFRRMGINPKNPQSVLIQPTPSGGRHYYVFFDEPYLLIQYHQLLQAGKLRHVRGEIEFYPSTQNGLRLPFGHIPGTQRNPDAWIQFVDDYRNKRIIQHSLTACYESLTNFKAVQSRRILSLRAARSRPSAEFVDKAPSSSSPPKSVNNPTGDMIQRPEGLGRYLRLLKGIQNSTEAEELRALGILLPGTRTQVLNLLAAHLIWFKHHPKNQASNLLIDWAMTSRHASKDIQDDLTNGTTKVATHIRTMCRWYESHKRNSDLMPTNTNPSARFAPLELQALRPRLTDLNPDDRANQSQFLLHFLMFAKRHGSAALDGTGWFASPAVRPIIRRWPGCHHMNYARRIRHAVTRGCIEVVRGAWHRPNSPGRARTYRLSVPVVPSSEWILPYDAALAFLLGEEPSRLSSESPKILLYRTGEEPSHADHSARSDPIVSTA